MKIQTYDMIKWQRGKKEEKKESTIKIEHISFAVRLSDTKYHKARVRTKKYLRSHRTGLQREKGEFAVLEAEIE